MLNIDLRSPGDFVHRCSSRQTSTGLRLLPSRALTIHGPSSTLLYLNHVRFQEGLGLCFPCSALRAHRDRGSVPRQLEVRNPPGSRDWGSQDRDVPPRVDLRGQSLHVWMFHVRH